MHPHNSKADRLETHVKESVDQQPGELGAPDRQTLPPQYTHIYLYIIYYIYINKINALEGVDQLPGELALGGEGREAQADAHVAVKEDGLWYVDGVGVCRTCMFF